MTLLKFLLIGWRSDVKAWAITWALLLIIVAALAVACLAAYSWTLPIEGTANPPETLKFSSAHIDGGQSISTARPNARCGSSGRLRPGASFPRHPQADRTGFSQPRSPDPTDAARLRGVFHFCTRPTTTIHFLRLFQPGRTAWGS